MSWIFHRDSASVPGTIADGFGVVVGWAGNGLLGEAVRNEIDSGWDWAGVVVGGVGAGLGWKRFDCTAVTNEIDSG